MVLGGSKQCCVRQSVIFQSPTTSAGVCNIVKATCVLRRAYTQLIGTIFLAIFISIHNGVCKPRTRWTMGKIRGCGGNSISIQILVIIVVSGYLLLPPPAYARTITDSSPLDNLIIRPLFHKFRNITFGIVGPTSLLRRTGKFYQSPLRQFPCDTSYGRSPEPPTSVHKLRPGKGLMCFFFFLFWSISRWVGDSRAVI